MICYLCNKEITYEEKDEGFIKWKNGTGAHPECQEDAEFEARTSLQ